MKNQTYHSLPAQASSNAITERRQKILGAEPAIRDEEDATIYVRTVEGVLVEVGHKARVLYVKEADGLMTAAYAFDRLSFANFDGLFVEANSVNNSVEDAADNAEKFIGKTIALEVKGPGWLALMVNGAPVAAGRHYLCQECEHVH